MRVGRSGLRGKIYLVVLALWVSACQPVTTPASSTLSVQSPTAKAVVPAAEVAETIQLSASATLRPATATRLRTATLTPSPTVTPTPDPYAGLTILDLASRSYGEGELEIVEKLAENSYFTRYLISYPSDGLEIYGFMNVPVRAELPYPVVIALHGYIDPDIYRTLDYTTGYADTLARAGYLVLHPNLRGYPPSDEGENLFRVGMAIDVLNLIGIVKKQGGQPGPLKSADPDAIGLWGHSMGGGISLRVITVSQDVKAAVLYGAMSGDERQNFEAIDEWSDGQRGQEELAIPEGDLVRISPIHFLDRIRAAVSVHHGEDDELVPLAWTVDLCWRLQVLNQTFECFTYPGQPHTFNAAGEEIFMERVVNFFDRELR